MMTFRHRITSIEPSTQARDGSIRFARVNTTWRFTSSEMRQPSSFSTKYFLRSDSSVSRKEPARYTPRRAICSTRREMSEA